MIYCLWRPGTNRQGAHKAGRVAAIIFLLLGIGSIVYFFIIVSYAGIDTSFGWIWVVFSIVFFLMAYYTVTSLRHPGGMPRALPTFIFTTFSLFSLVFLLVMSIVVSDSRGVREESTLDYVIVPGAKVYSDGISMTLKLRLDKALEYYREHPDVTIVLSGGKEKTDAVAEAGAMFNYLSLNHVPTQQMIIDTEGTSTAEIMRRAWQKIRERERDGLDQAAIGVITSDYHLMRCLKVLEAQGANEPTGIPAPSDRVLFVHQCVRESMAIAKDTLMGNFTFEEGDLPFELPFINRRERR